jgi:hypothetical protein
MSKTYRNTLLDAPKPEALTVQVLYTTYGGVVSDCTNGGVTAKSERVILVPIGADVPTDSKLPVLKVVCRYFGGLSYLHAEPVTPVGKNLIGYMAGGNFVYSCDSRFRTWVSQYPISVHDRVETQAQYNSLSV